MKKISSLIVLLSVLLMGNTARAQQLDSIMEAQSQFFPKEKVHIHFDKQLYNTDETVWYKLYLLTETGLSMLSQNVYVDWYDQTGKLLRQTVAPLFQSTAKGSFDIPGNYTGEFVRVKAYTRWMLNDDSSFLYQKDIPINRGAELTPRKQTVTRTKVELFPEGGVLVQGLNEKVAFKATNQFGLPANFRGALLNDKGQVLDSLIIKHDGMGFFFLRAQAGEKYRVDWMDANGVRGTTPVNGIKNDGVSLGVATTNDKAILHVQRTATVPDDHKQLILLVHMNEQPLFKVMLNMLEKTDVRAAVPIDELPTGIVQFTLFTQNWVPLEERIIFVNNHTHEFNAKINPGIVNMEKRARNVLEILVTDTATTNMSVSITDAGLAGEEHFNIFSDFMLTNQLKGYIHKPAYYLKSDADSITSKLDLVMLTNGWRKFDWERVRKAELPVLKYAPETDFMRLKGKVFGLGSLGATSGAQLNLIITAKDSSKNMYFVPVQKDGSFDEPLDFFYDTAKVYYNFNNKNNPGNVAQLQLANGLLRKEPGSSLRMGQQPYVETMSDSLIRARMDMFLKEEEKLRRSMATATLDEVVVQSKIQRKTPTQILDEKYASGLFSGGDSYGFDLEGEKFLGAPDVLTYLMGKVAGLQIAGGGSQMSLSWRGSTPVVYLNEMMSDVSVVQNIPLADIAYVKVLRPPFFGAPGGGAGGAIAIYTKKGGGTRKDDPSKKGMETTILSGYSRFREFYNPTYEKEGPAEADVRSTLYWNPYIITNKRTPRFRVEFYNNDFSRKLLVVLEGINADGKMTRTVRLLE